MFLFVLYFCFYRMKFDTNIHIQICSFFFVYLIIYLFISSFFSFFPFFPPSSFLSLPPTSPSLPLRAPALASPLPLPQARTSALHILFMSYRLSVILVTLPSFPSPSPLSGRTVMRLTCPDVAYSSPFAWHQRVLGDVKSSFFFRSLYVTIEVELPFRLGEFRVYASFMCSWFCLFFVRQVVTGTFWLIYCYFVCVLFVKTSTLSPMQLIISLSLFT